MKKIKNINIQNNVFVNICILSLGIMLDYIINIFIMKRNSLSQYGKYNLILSYGSVLGIILGFGFPEIIKKELKEFNIEIKSLIFNLLIKSLSIAIIILTVFILFFVNGRTQIFMSFAVTTVVIASICKNILYATYISTKKILKYYVLDKIIFKILTIIIFFILSVNEIKLEIILIYKYLFEFFISLILLKKFLKLEFRKIKKGYLKYGYYLMLHQITDVSIILIDKILIKKIINYEAVGIYSFYYMLSSLILFPMNVVQSKFYPSFAKAIRERNNLELKKLYVITREMGIYIILPLIFIYINYSQTILSLISKDIDGYSKLLIYLTFTMYINVFSGLNGTIINLSEYYRIQFYLKIIFILITILGNVFFLKKYGLNGAALSSSVCLIIYNFSKGIIVYIKERIHPFSKDIFKEFLLMIIFFLLNYIIKKFFTINILFLILLTIFHYCIILFVDGKKVIKYIFLD